LLTRTVAIFTRLVNFCWVIFQWGLLLAVAAALVVGGYLYLWLDDEILRQVQHRLAGHYRGLQVHVGSARFEQDRGIAIYDVTLAPPWNSDKSEPLVSIEELHLAGNIRMEELISSQPRVEEIIIRRARLHAVRAKNGRWNVASLLPLPRFSEQRPEIRIENTTIVVEDATRATPSTISLHDANLTLTPLQAADPHGKPARYRIVGSVMGIPARELRFEGEVGTEDQYLDLSVTVGGLEVTGNLLASLPGLEQVLPSGADVSARADIELRVIRPAARAAFEVSGKLKVDRGRLTYPRLPEPLTDLEIKAHFDRSRLHIESLTGKFGPASVTLACERAGWAPNAPLALAAKIVGLSLDQRFKAALPESLARVWRRFQPAGIVDVDVRATFDGRRWQPQLSAECRGVSLTDADKFPYPLEQARGSLEYTPASDTAPDRLQMNLVAVGAGRPVRIAADLTQVVPGEVDGEAVGSGPTNRRRHPVGWVEITGSDIPLHEQLIAALPDKNGEPLVRSLRPQGAIDFHFRAEWIDPFQPRADVTKNIQLKNCAIQYVPFPYPLHRVNGLVAERNGHWTLQDIKAGGADETTVVTCSGTSTPLANGCRVDLFFQADSVPLDDNLKRALQPPAQLAWNELRPQGRINFTAQVLHETGLDRPRVSVTMRPCQQTVSIEPLKFPYRFEQIEGVAKFEAGNVQLADIRAQHDRVEYSAATGTWQPRADGGWQLDLRGVNADRFAPYGDRDLLVALPPALQSIAERLQPSGTVSVVNSSLSLAKSPQSNRLAAAWDVNLDCHQAALQGGLPLQSFTGGIHLRGRHDEQASYTFGELKLDSVLWKDMQFTNVRGPLWIDQQSCLLGNPASAKLTLPARKLTADTYGGSLTANAELQHVGNPNYKLDLAVDGLSLARFANERLGGPSELSGNVSGRLLLTGTGRSVQTLNGNGELHVVDANIYELPVLMRLLKVLTNRPPTTTAFNRCDMQFAIRGEHVHFQQLNLLGDAVSLYGKGETNFDRELDLVFYTLIGPADLPIPLLKSLAGQVSQQGLQLKVAGSWDDPDVQRKPFPAVNDMIQQIQSGAATMAPATAVRDAFIPR
jgi:hypothetical protein